MPSDDGEVFFTPDQVVQLNKEPVMFLVSYWAGDPIWFPENWASGRSFSP